METLQREMIKMQEHNNILSSKLDDTHKQLHEQQSHSAQLPGGLERTTRLRQERSLRSVPKPSDREAGKQLAQDRPSTSRRLFVPTSAEHNQEYQVYSDCRDRINHRRRERQTSPIHVQAKLNDRHLEALGPKSPLRRRYNEIGLEETDESDYIPTSLGTTLSRQSTTLGSARGNDWRQGRPTVGSEAQGHEGHLPIGPRTVEPFGTDLPTTDPTIRLLLQKVSRIEEEQNQIRTPTWGKTDRLYSADDLYTIRQGDSEPLREYAARFSHEYSRCLETDDRAAFGAFKSGLRASQFRYLVHNSKSGLMKQATIHAKAEHFNSKGMPSASGPSATTGQPSFPTYDNFQPRQTTIQVPYRTAPTVPAPYTPGDKRRDSFQGRQDGGKRNKESGGRNFRSTKIDRPPEVFTILNSSYEHVLMAENQMIPKPSLRKLPR
ncbi:unnamed protein product [Prunus brigantina]